MKPGILHLALLGQAVAQQTAASSDMMFSAAPRVDGELHANTPPGGRDYFVFQISLRSAPLLCLDVPGANAVNGNKLQIWECNGHASQLFYFDSGSYKIRFVGNPNKCIDAGAAMAPGTSLQLWDCNGLDQQTWGYDAKVGSIFLYNSKADAQYCMDVLGGATKGGTAVDVWDCNGEWQQSWNLMAGVTIRAADNYRICLDLTDGKQDNGTPIQLWDCDGLSNQYWIFEDNKIKLAVNKNKCIDAGKMTDGTFLMLWDCNGLPQQNFWYDSKAGTVYLSSSQDATMCMDIQAGETVPGTGMWVFHCNGCWNQGFLVSGPGLTSPALSGSASDLQTVVPKRSPQSNVSLNHALSCPPHTWSQGFVQDNSNGNFLSCQDSGCSWQPSPTQIFRKSDGDANGRYRFHLLDADGKDTGKCLVRQDCHSDTTGLISGPCNRCGTGDWQYDGGRFAADTMKSCIQENGKLGACSKSYASIKYPVAPDCKVKSQQILNMRCKNHNTGGTCSAGFEKGSSVGGHSENDCNACKAAKGSSLQCTFNMGVTVSHSITSSFSKSTGVKIETGVEWKTDLIFEEEKTHVNVDVSTTLTTGKSTTKSQSYTVSSSCSATIQAGTRESATANFVAGTIVGDFIADVVTTYECGWKKPHTETTTGTLRISNVPTESVDGSCTPVAESCNAEQQLLPFLQV